MSIHELALQGKKQISTSMARNIVSGIYNINNEVIKNSLLDFKNIEHRLEHITSISGIEYINDSKSTTLNSAWYALESMQKPTIWIAGGTDNNNDYKQIKNIAKEKVKAIVCFGEDKKKIYTFFKTFVKQVFIEKNIKNAVQKSYQLSTKGDVVLFSPSCSSFDMFNDYEDRGREFKKQVLNL